MRPAIAPTNHEIINELLAMPQISRMSQLRRLGRACELKNEDGDIIGGFEYLGYYFDTFGDIRGSEWYEINDNLVMKIILVGLSIPVFALLCYAYNDLLIFFGVI